jgi:hypothetical protein
LPLEFIDPVVVVVVEFVVVDEDKDDGAELKGSVMIFDGCLFRRGLLGAWTPAIVRRTPVYYIDSEERGEGRKGMKQTNAFTLTDRDVWKIKIIRQIYK